MSELCGALHIPGVSRGSFATSGLRAITTCELAKWCGLTEAAKFDCCG